MIDVMFLLVFVLFAGLVSAACECTDAAGRIAISTTPPQDPRGPAFLSGLSIRVCAKNRGSYYIVWLASA